MLRNVHAAKVEGLGGWGGAKKHSLRPSSMQELEGEATKGLMSCVSAILSKTPKPHAPHPKFLAHHPQQSRNPTGHIKFCCVHIKVRQGRREVAESPSRANMKLLTAWPFWFCLPLLRRFTLFLRASSHTGWYGACNLWAQNCNIFSEGLRQHLHFFLIPPLKIFYLLPPSCLNVSLPICS